MPSSHKKNICELITNQEGNYFFVVKDNQKSRREDIKHYFEEQKGTPIEEISSGHGRVETRILWVEKTPFHLYHWSQCKHL